MKRFFFMALVVVAGLDVILDDGRFRSRVRRRRQ